MSDFFHGWRRKAACLGLVMAAAITCGWIRSFARQDVVSFRIVDDQAHFLVSQAGTVTWIMVDGDKSSPWTWNSIPLLDSDIEEITYPVEWSALDLSTFDPSESGEWKVFYSWFTLPLIALSAYLLLCPGKRTEKSRRPREERTDDVSVIST